MTPEELVKEAEDRGMKVTQVWKYPNGIWGMNEKVEGEMIYLYRYSSSVEIQQVDSEAIDKAISHSTLILDLESTPKPKTTSIPLVDNSIFTGLSYEVYETTVRRGVAAVKQTAFEQFIQVINRRLREWPTCCGCPVEFGVTEIDSTSTTRVFGPEMFCKNCKRSSK